MPTKKKSKPALANDAPPDPREPLPPTPANLTATLAELKAVLADLPTPEPVAERTATGLAAADSARAAEAETGVDGVPSEAKGVEAKGEAKGAEAKGAEAKGADARGTEAKGAEATAPDGKAGDGGKEPQPGLDLVEALLHISFADGLPCGYGQEARRRIAESFVDRNEFRVTEAFEVEDLLRDLPIPDLFARCLSVRDAIAQIYNDQNGVNLGFLRDAGVSDRNTFFQRVPAVPQHVANFLINLLTIEEIVFSDKSTLRAQQRIGLDPKNAPDAKFVDEVRALLKPFGQLPLDVGPHLSSGKPNLKHTLSPASLLVRLAPAGKRRG